MQVIKKILVLKNVAIIVLIIFGNWQAQGQPCPVVLMAQQNSLQGVAKLAAQHANLHCTDSLHRNALHYAVLNRNEGLIRFLVAKKLDANTPDVHGKTPVIMACDQNDWIFLNYLLTTGGNLNYKLPDGRPLLLYYIDNKKPTIAHKITTRGADLSTPDSQGRYPLTMAIKNKYYDLAIIMALLGANISSPDYPLFLAIETQNTNLVKTLIGRCTNLQQTGPNGETIRQAAQNTNNPQIISIVNDVLSRQVK